MEGFLLAHPRGSRAFLWGFGAFFSCALFPALPVSGSPWHMWWLGTLAALWAWQEAGRIQAALFPGRLAREQRGVKELFFSVNCAYSAQ